MADSQMGPPNLSFTMSNKAVSGMGGTSSGLNTPANYMSVAALRGALAAANGTYYTSARLDALTVNDMIFALRNIQDPTTIASYMSASTA